MNLFSFFIFNYELDIFYPFFKNDKKCIFKFFIYRFENFTAPTAPTAPNSTEIQKSSASVEYRVIINCTWTAPNCTKLNWDKEIFGVWWTAPTAPELHQLHLELHPTAPTAPKLHQYGNLRYQLMTRGFFFIIICEKCNIVKICECDEYEFLRGLWESDMKNCNSGELHLTAPKCVFVSE